MENKMKRLIIGLACVLSLTGCVTAGTTTTKVDPTIVAGNSLYAAQQTILNVRKGAVTPCKTGLIPKPVCAQISDIYEQSKPVYDLAVDADILYMTTPTPGNQAEANAKAMKFMEFVTNASAIALKYSIQGAK
jgi:hypothetical protein